MNHRGLIASTLAALVLLIGSAGANAATLYISEFPNAVGVVGTTTAQVYPQPAITDQTVAITGASVQSSAFSATTHAIQVECDADCSIAIGANPTATTTNYLMGDGTPYQFVVIPGQKIAVISNTSGGSGSDVNIVAVGGNTVTTSVPVSIISGGGGTSSTFGAAFPATGTAAGFTDGTNMQAAKVDSAGDQLVVGAAASGATNTGNPVKAGLAYSTTQPTVSTGQTVDAQADINGNLGVYIVAGAQTGADAIANTALLSQFSATSHSAQALRLQPTAGFVFNGTTWDRARSDTGLIGIAATVNQTTTSAGAALTPVVSTTLESCHVIKASAGNLYSFEILTQATAGIVQVFNATSAPGDGAVTPVNFYNVAASSTVGFTFDPPENFATGITICFSSATTPFTKTASATAAISGNAK